MSEPAPTPPPPHGGPPAALPVGVRAVSEVPFGESDIPLWIHPGWADALPWLIQGATARGEGPEPFDLALFGEAPAGAVRERWARVGRALDAPRLVHGRQVHGRSVRFHREGPPGLNLSPDTDGHVTRTAGVLLTVATADCVAISVVDPVRRAVVLLHGGWRGAAAGILEEGLAVLGERVRSEPRELHLHLGPAICGACYEVGPEVHEALGLAAPAGPEPVDLRAVLARRAVALGVPPGQVTISEHCTRCGDSPFFSHRAGCRERQLAVLGVAP